MPEDIPLIVIPPKETVDHLDHLLSTDLPMIIVDSEQDLEKALGDNFVGSGMEQTFSEECIISDSEDNFDKFSNRFGNLSEVKIVLLYKFV